MKNRPYASTPLRLTLALVCAGALWVAGFTLAGSVAPNVAAAGSEDDLAEKRTYWQDQYRRLRNNQATLEANIAKSTKNYAQAQRRNYPRGGARDQFRIDADKARKELEVTKAEIETLFDDARRAGVPPGWLAEVEGEPVVAHQPAAADSPSNDEDREGRNPLYFDN